MSSCGGTAPKSGAWHTRWTKQTTINTATQHPSFADLCARTLITPNSLYYASPGTAARPTRPHAAHRGAFRPASFTIHDLL